MSKKSIRFFNEREVRAVWDEEISCWWFSATDVARAVNDEPDYTKADKRHIKRAYSMFIDFLNATPEYAKFAKRIKSQQLTKEMMDAFAEYDMEYPDYEFHCTLAASRRCLDIPSHQLHLSAAACGYDMTNHHHALCDAEACAAIALKIL